MSAEKLDENYLGEFKQKVLLFLKGKVDEQLKNEGSVTELKSEKEAQSYFVKQKTETFMGQEENSK